MRGELTARMPVLHGSWTDGRILDIAAENKRSQHFVPGRNKALGLVDPKVECDEAVDARAASDSDALLAGLLGLLAYLLADIGYALADPRVSYD